MTGAQRGELACSGCKAGGGHFTDCVSFRGAASPGGQDDEGWKPPTNVDLWGTRPRSSGRFNEIRGSGDPFKGVRREN